MYIHRDEAIRRIKAALKAKTGKTWSVTGGRGTAWGWITVQAPPKRRINHVPNPEFKPWMTMADMSPWLEVPPPDGERGHYTSDAERAELAETFGFSSPVHHQGLSIGPDETERYVVLAERGI